MTPEQYQILRNIFDDHLTSILYAQFKKEYKQKDWNAFKAPDLCKRLEEAGIQIIFPKNNSISINIWDDFYDDGHVPEGKSQSTSARVEGDTDDETAEKGMKCLYDFIKDLPILAEVQMTLNGDRIYFKNLTHKILDELMSLLDKKTLTIEGYRLRIYSES
jgi:hypothetical protein